MGFEVLFLISNSFCGFGFGLFLFAFGVGSSVVMGVTDGFATCIGIGGLIIGLSLVGFCGAIAKNDKRLCYYASGMAILTALEIVHLVVLSKSPLIHNPNDVGLRAYFITMIFIIVVSIVSILLAGTMTYHIRQAQIRSVTEFAEKRQQNLHP